jgi:hypothetical protein
MNWKGSASSLVTKHSIQLGRVSAAEYFQGAFGQTATLSAIDRIGFSGLSELAQAPRSAEQRPATSRSHYTWKPSYRQAAQLVERRRQIAIAPSRVIKLWPASDFNAWVYGALGGRRRCSELQQVAEMGERRGAFPTYRCFSKPGSRDAASGRRASPSTRRQERPSGATFVLFGQTPSEATCLGYVRH